MTQLSVGQAAKLTGKSKSTISRAIESGRMSADRKDPNGPYSINVSELERVFPLLPQPAATGSATSQMTHYATPPSMGESAAEIRALQVELQGVRDRLADKDSVIDDLRRRLDAEAEERRKLTMLLTDQRRAEPEPVPVAPEKPAGGRFTRAWAILTGKG